MALRDASIRALKPQAKSYRQADGKGLYIEVFPNGSKLWRLKYRIAGKEKRLALGAFPEVSLTEARKGRDLARRKVADGIDPLLERKKSKARAEFDAQSAFSVIANEYIAKMEKEGRAPATLRKARWFASLLLPSIGRVPVSEVDPQMLLAALRKLESKGNYESAKKVRSFASRVFRYAVMTGRSKSDPAALLSGALITHKVKHYSAILEPARFGELLRAIEGYDGNPVVKKALQLSPHVFVRPGELRNSTWNEFDFESAIWRIPSARMKSRKAHAVPLSRQVLELLVELRAMTESADYVLPSAFSVRRPISENTVNGAFRRMGFDSSEVTAHGLRASASTFLNESGIWNPDAIERALAHGPSDAVRGAYHRGTHWPERVQMAQWWSDYLDSLKAGGEVLQFPIAAAKDAARSW